METKAERFNAVIAYLQQTKYRFAENLKVSKSLISKLTTQNDVNFRVDILDKLIEKYPQININWLLSGRGKMIIDNEVTIENYYNSNAVTYNQSLVDIMKIAEHFYSSGMSNDDFTKKLDEELKKSGNKALQYMVQSAKELSKEHPELLEVNNLIEETIVQIHTLSEINAAYLIKPKNTEIEFKTYEDFKANRLKLLQPLLKYAAPVGKLHLAIGTFIEDFKQFDTEKIID